MRSRVAAGIAAVIAAVTVGVVAVANGSHGPRVLLVGDSLLEESAPQAKHELHAAGLRGAVRAVPGIGLLDARFDWIAEVRRLVASDRPRVVVAEFAGNYEPPYRAGIAPFSPAFFRAWTDAMRRLVAAAATTGAAVEVVLLPPMRDRVLDSSAATLNGVYAALAGGMARVGCIDGHGPLANTAGGYADVLPAPNGRLDRVRRSDGVHLTVAGARRLGHAIAAGAVRAAHGGGDACPA